MTIPAVQFTSEFGRVLSLPRRTWIPDPDHAAALTSLLRQGRGEMSFRDVQAWALTEAHHVGGLFAPIRVGAGKTLISLLFFLVVGARRPLLLIPAKLREKTRRDSIHLAQHWRIPNFIRIESYEMLGRAQSANMLELYQPDAIFADEAHRLRNVHAAVTKRVGRWMSDHPLTRFGAASGTITKRSLRDYWHIMRWCLKAGGMPLPSVWSELQIWANALDQQVDERLRALPGALSLFAEGLSYHQAFIELEKVRQGYRRRMVETPGVVVSLNDHVAASIQIEGRELPTSSAQDAAFAKLRSDWETPDGWALADAMSVWRVARELSLGFFYRWDPRPPKEWIIARREWAHACREIIGNNHRRLDSELMVRREIDHYPWALPILEAWRTIEPTFTPNTVPVWLDDQALALCERWCSEGPGIVWCEHVAFAKELAKRTGLSYYAREGRDHLGRLIDDADPGKAIIASVASNSEGRNLQAWSRNLITSVPANGVQWEQLIGRTHRDGQEADEVTFDVLFGCGEHIRAFWRAKSDAQYTLDTTGAEQKLLIADITYPENPPGDGARWQ